MRCKRAWLASAELRTWANIFLPKSTSFRRAPHGVPSTDCARSSIPTGYSKTNSLADCSLTPGRRPPNDAGVSFDLDGTLTDSSDASSIRWKGTARQNFGSAMEYVDTLGTI